MRDQHINHNRTFLLLGSNIDPNPNIRKAAAEIDSKFKIINISKIYKSPAVTGSRKIPQGDYLNLVLEINPNESLNALIKNMKSIESSLGRVRTSDKFEARTIDIDIILIDGVYVNLENIELPDPEILEYPHIFVPLAEIASEVITENFNKSIAQISSKLNLSSVKVLCTYEEL